MIFKKNEGGQLSLITNLIFFLQNIYIDTFFHIYCLQYIHIYIIRGLFYIFRDAAVTIILRAGSIALLETVFRSR